MKVYRLFHPCQQWEDFKFNFHGNVGTYEQENTVKLCADLLRDLPRFERALFEIVNTWHFSCEHNLTNEAMNRIAYLGQAACALRLNVPSGISMGAWSTLSKEEQVAADALAKRYLDLFLEKRTVRVIA